MTLRTWPGMAGGLLTLLLCGCQSANWFAHNREQREPPGSSLADRRDDSRPERSKSPEKSPKESGTKIARTGSDSGSKRTSSKSPAEWYTEGARLENERHYSEARAAYEHAIDADPSFAEAHHRLGVIADRGGEFPLADRHYNKAHELKPSDPSILSDMGFSLYLRKQDREAERLLKQALELDPQHADANGNLAQVCVRQKRYDEAFAALKRIEPFDVAKAKLASMLPPGSPSIEEIAQREGPDSTPLRGGIQQVAGSGAMSSDQARWLEEQTQGSDAAGAGRSDQKVIHAGGANEFFDEAAEQAAPPAGRGSLPTIAPIGGSGPQSATPQAGPLVAEAGGSTRPAPTGNGGFWQGTPLPAVEPGTPRLVQNPTTPPAAAPANPVLPRATITDITPRNDVALTSGTAPATAPDRNSISRLAALAGLDAGPGSLFPTGATAALVPVASANPPALGAANPWGNSQPAGSAQELPTWPGRDEQPSAPGVVQAGGTLADWPAARKPAPGVQPPQGDPLAAFQYEIDQQAAAQGGRILPGGPATSAVQPAGGTDAGFSPWPAPSASTTTTAGTNRLAAQLDTAPRSGSAQPWPPSRSQTLQKPIAPVQAIPSVAWPAPQVAQPLPAWPSETTQR